MCDWKISIGHDQNSDNIVMVSIGRMGNEIPVNVADNMSPALLGGSYPIYFTHIHELEERAAWAIFNSVKAGSELVRGRRISQRAKYRTLG